MRVIAGLRLVFSNSWASNQQHVPGWHYFQAKRRPRLEETGFWEKLDQDESIRRTSSHVEDVKHSDAKVASADHSSSVAASQQQHEQVTAPLPPPAAPPVAPPPVSPPASKSVFEDLRREGVLDSVSSRPVLLSERARERNIPSSPLGRFAAFSGLALNLGLGAAGEAFRRGVMGGEPIGNSVFISERNAQVLVDALCKMRGAALKIGQFLSIQDEGVVPKELVRIFDRVRQDADVMPAEKVEQIITSELGSDWRSRISSFEEKPIAAASIGQVHKLVLADGTPCVMKVQYPGVARSIDSDVKNLSTLLNLTNLVPPGLYLEKALSVLSKELALECNYENEARNQMLMRSLIERDRSTSSFYVPRVIEELSTSRVLTSELVSGVRMESLIDLPQAARDKLGELIMTLCLKELFVWRFMQVDPNYSNFLLDFDNERVNLLDFGACLKFDDEFVDLYKSVITAAAENDREKVLQDSIKLGFLTGKESSRMKDAHVDSVMALGQPFQSRGPYDFSRQTVTSTVKENVEVMLNERLTPPPQV
jgi:aarF domain-containing kinase